MLEVGFYLLFTVIISALGAELRKAAFRSGMTDKGANRVQLRYIIVMVLWIIYLSVMVAVGAFKELKSPPSILLFIILPAFTIIAIFHTSKNAKKLVEGFAPEMAVTLQSFRIFVELLILGVYMKGLGPIEITFEGNNFDILAGVSAPVIGWLLYKKVISEKVVLVWNILCLLLLANIVFIFNSMIMKPQIWGYEGTPIHPDFAAMPYLLIAAVFMPVAVFLHIISIRKSLK